MADCSNDELRASVYDMACGINQEIITDMARQYEQDLIISGSVPLSVIKQRKAEERKISEQKDLSKYNSVSESKVLSKKGAGIPSYALQVLNIMDILNPSDVREISYSGDNVSIISGTGKKNYKIETKGRKVVGIKFKGKVFVEM